MLLNILIVVLVLIGLGITLVNLPGVWLIWLVILGHGIYTNFVEVPIWFIVIAFIFSVFIGLVDNIAILLGAKKLGGSKWGMIGAFVGAIIGLLIFNIIGLIIGAFVGAVVFELSFEQKDVENALRSGFGTTLGFFAGVFFKFVFTFFMVVAWVLFLWK